MIEVKNIEVSIIFNFRNLNVVYHLIVFYYVLRRVKEAGGQVDEGGEGGWEVVKGCDRGKGKDGIVLNLELISFINTVFGLLQLYSTPSRVGITTFSPPSPLCLQT